MLSNINGVEVNMNKTWKTKRDFNISDAQMLQTSRVVYGIFSEDKLMFEEFDLSFNDPFAGDWLKKIEFCDTLLLDSEYMGAWSVLKEKTENIMEECRSFFYLMKYFIEKAFPGRKDIRFRFGFEDYESARKSRYKMIRFLENLAGAAREYETELTSVDFDRDKIDEIDLLIFELTNAVYGLEMNRVNREAVTGERVMHLNECYLYMRKVCKAGKIIFVSDYAKYNQYLLPEGKKRHKEVEYGGNGAEE